ncbi:hypothetical protein HBI64_252440 [Parastagonospora nodorum]|nr:hypothetical protein HBI64_252440 [Parastagonospora nodorum]
MNLPGVRRRGTTSCEEGAAAQSDTREREEIENYAKRNSTVFITRDYTTIKLIRLSNFYMKNALRSVQSFLLLSHLADPFHQMLWGTQKRRTRELVILLSQLLTNDGMTLCGTPVNLWLDAHRSKTAPLPVRSSIATTPCRKVTAAYALNYLELRPASPQFLNSAIAAIIARAFYNNGKWGIGFLSANMMALVGTVLYNAIKEYHDDGTRKTIHFHGYTVEDNYNAICEKWKRLSEICRLLIWDALKQQIAIHANYIENSRSNVTVLDDYHDNDVDDILMKCTDDERQRYNTLIEDYNCAGKREDNILTVDECRTSHSNEEDIEADEREEETRVRLRELSGEIHDILLREFRGADDFTESVTHNDDEQVWFQNKGKGWSIVTDSTWDEFAMLAEEYTIDNRIVHALALTKDEWELEPEDCDALVERYEEEINCSDLYSTV